MNALNLDTVVRAYIAAALWSSLDDDCEPLDARFTAADLHPETLAIMRADCAAFIAAYADLIARLPDSYGDAARRDGCPDDDACAAALGHDLWLTRNRHGVGFWGRGLGELGDVLTDAANAMGERDLWADEYGLIHPS